MDVGRSFRFPDSHTPCIFPDDAENRAKHELKLKMLIAPLKDFL